MMGRIYQSADLVLAWLGDCSSKLAQGLPGLEALAKKLPSELPPYPDIYDSNKFRTIYDTAASLGEPSDMVQADLGTVGVLLSKTSCLPLRRAPS